MPAGSTSQSQPASPLKVAIATIVFWPYGLYLLWNHPTLGKRTNWWLGGIAYVVLFTAIISRFDSGALEADARKWARMEKECQTLMAKADKLQAEGKGKAAMMTNLEGAGKGMEMTKIRDKYQAKDDEFMKAVEKARASL
jgi:hypothetical protein